ncbi:AAA family ATPase [Corynebacterium freiburgense]|uniref:AAA family ATPase n=1 Tax=Corynebacterium freiburgense TaxID=556548 RepID=UPI0003F72B62|nr:AAA family ATPase [Corynebacterium freiburgense]WJZ01371.1 ATP-dependent zinc metalloprotease FtsH [Corynebacterium freiburgense]
MPNYHETTDIIRRYLKARVPLIVINSIEPKRVLDILKQLSRELQSLPFFEYSSAEGLREMSSGQTVIDDQSLISVLEHARTVFKSRMNVNFVFTEIDDLSADTPTARHFAQMTRIAEPHQGSLIMVVDKPVWSGLSRLGMTVALDLPTTDELFETVEDMIEGHRGTVPIEWQHQEMRQAAEMLSGITEAEAINVLATLIVKGEVRNEDLTELSHFKDAIFGELTGIERIRLREDYQIGGLRNLKQWLRKREWLIKADLSNSNLHPPKGVLLCGVPGCGKSLSAKAIAYEWGLPLYRLDMSSVLGMYVGESESNLREALATADRVAPCVLWIDEIEKALASTGSDGNVTKRLIGQFLFWLQESTSKVFMVATANDVATLPPELLRKGRFDEVFFVDLPTSQDREEIIQMCFRKYININPPHELVTDLVGLSEGFAGSDIDAVIHDIASDMLAHQSTMLPDAAYIRDLFANVMPFSKSNPEEVAAIRSWGHTRAVPAGESLQPTSSVPTPTVGRQVVL